MLNIRQLPLDVTAAVQAICPIDGISFGSLTDKSTWALMNDGAASGSQLAAAQAAIAAFDLSGYT